VKDPVQVSQSQQSALLPTVRRVPHGAVDL
jgi:hypothetical protein